ncbi:extracellular solute-binding protein [Neorhizobium galegae]|uniref:extracellular solute-binding protein n=1 Tax=Neorhizobium galegae TaxID=399 RepID=UPI000621463B|nr:extracellular solute-binding protein [Neorhizobium galegae]CDZ26545.1 Substrate-binding protein MsmE [Neorhizobium galegae bv. officinalis]KAA9383517.1 extracellular solute-binding protein [Neorhizobium galegae]KAB1111650.1 extracellular solute-binding protein [Neorhizobium galegae]MCM2500128.1 extracellular solute-binding protein [Neorhizobium galegae]MCQ1768461.1 extracellular solute-binding protein [Neorhizobium galegae]
MKIYSIVFASLLGATALGATGANAQSTPACTGETVTLRILRTPGNYPYPKPMEAWQKENPCVKFDVNEVPFPQLADTISVQAASSNPPDIIVYDGPNTQSYAAAGILLPITKYLPKGWDDDILPATKAEHSYNGEVYSPGIEQTTVAMYYNKKLVEAAGVKPPQTLAEAWTWPQALEAFKKCQQGPAGAATVWGLGPTRFGNGQPGLVYQDLIYQRSAGDPKAAPTSSAYKTFWAFAPDGKTAEGYLNTPEAVEALKFYQSMFNAEGVAPKVGIPNAFFDAKACFYIDTPAAGNALIKDPKIEWGITPLPYFKTPVVHTGSTTFGATARSKHPEIAAKFVVDMSWGEYAYMNVSQRGNLPTLKSLFSRFDVYNKYPMKVFVDQLQSWGQPRPPGPKFAQYDKIVSEALRGVAFGGNPAELMADAEKKVQRILDR